MTRKTPVNVAASVRARLLKVSKELREDFTLTLVNYASERTMRITATASWGAGRPMPRWRRARCACDFPAAPTRRAIRCRNRIGDAIT